MAVQCKKCGQELNDVADGEPCPFCGEVNGVPLLTSKYSVTTVGATASDTAITIPLWTKLLEVAEELFNKEFYGSAVIIAQTACEVIVARAMTKALGNRPVKKKYSSFSPANKRTRKLYYKLTDDNIRSEGFWNDYAAMVELRRDCVHKGLHSAISETDVRTGLDAAKKLVEHVEQHNKLP
jgi:HEPN domain-containing protein